MVRPILLFRVRKKFYPRVRLVMTVSREVVSPTDGAWPSTLDLVRIY